MLINAQGDLNVTQIWISDGNASMGDYLINCTESIKAAFPLSNYTLYDNKAIEEFLAGNFPREILAAYKTFVPYSYKSNLARYCILFKIGGWYMDLSVRWVYPLNIDTNIEFIAFRDVSTERMAHACQSGLFYAKPGHPALENAINKVIYNCSNRLYGATFHCVSGPGVLGGALADLDLDGSICFGDFVALTPNRIHKNYAYILPQGEIIAFWKPASVALDKLGAQGTNSYTAMWKEKKIYSDS